MDIIRIATEEDRVLILNLLQAENLPVADIPKDNQTFYVLQSNELIKAVGCIEVYGKQAIFRSFAVDKQARSKGLGRELHEYIIAKSSELNLESLYLLTTTAADYFQKLGWIRIAKTSVPSEIEKSDEFSNICPSSAECMFLALQEGPVKEAVSTFATNFNCSQSVFTAFSSDFGIDKTSALKLASGFGGGINSKGGLCGAVSGAYMALGLKYGRSEANDLSAKKLTSEMISKFDALFIEKNGALNCRDLLNRDVSIGEEREKLVAEGAFDKICPRLIKDSAEIVEHLFRK